MKVLLATSSLARFPHDPLAAHGNAVYELVRELGRWVTGTVLAPSQPEAPGVERLGGFVVRRIPPDRPWEPLHRAVLGPGVIRVCRMGTSLRRAVRRSAEEHDVVHGFWAYPGGWAAQGAGLPFVLTVPGTDAQLLTRVPGVRRLVAGVVRSADCCVVVDASGAESLRPFRPRDLQEIPTPLRLEDFPVAAPSPEPVLLYVGRLSWEKGVDLLIRALAIARSSVPTLRLVIVGNGPDGRRLRDIASALGQASAVEFRGARRHDEVPLLLAQARALLLASRWEGLPSVVLEALAVGRPVIATDVGGVSRLIGSQAGRIVRTREPYAFASAILEVVQASWDPQRLRARVRGFRVDQVARRYLELYRSLVAIPDRPAGAPASTRLDRTSQYQPGGWCACGSS